jgi:predicted esterase
LSAPVSRRAAPVVWFHGRSDRTVPYSVARSGCRRANTQGAGCGLVTFSGGHEIVATQAPTILRRAAAWLRRH